MNIFTCVRPRTETDDHSLEPPTTEAPPARRIATQPPRIRVLDGLRGCAILMVVASHVRYGFHPSSRGDQVVLGVMAMGWAGVDLFFVLSGFLITGLLLDSRGGDGFFRNFYRRRALRIFPLYYTFLAVTFVVAIARRDSSPDARMLLSHAGWYLAYLVNVLSVLSPGAALPWGTGPLWTLAVEEHFYLAWPTAVAALTRRNLGMLCGIAVVAVPLARMLLLAAASGGLVSHYGAYTANYALTPLRMDSLIMGAGVAILIRSAGWGNRIVLARRLLLPLLALLALIAVATRGFAWSDPIVQTIGFTTLAMTFSCLLVLCLANAHVGVRPWTLLQSRALTSLGRYSYAIYILHSPALLAADVVLPRQSLPTILGSTWPVAAIYTTVFTGLMWASGRLSFLLLEKRFLDLRERYPYTRTATAAMQSP